jgi:hypothetical protein
MRKLIVALVLAALAGATLAFAGGGTSGKGATHGLVRARSSGTAAGSSFASASATSSFGPNVIDRTASASSTTTEIRWSSTTSLRGGG